MISADREPFTPPQHLNTGPLTQLPEGFPFTDASPIRQLTEPAGIMLLPAIAGMTVMDDKVAAGVLAHSEFRSKPVRRGVGTARSAIRLVFGNEDEALAEAERIIKFHDTTVHGVENGVSYHANDAELQTWVLACVMNGIETSTQRWTKRGSYDREGLYNDVRTFGKFFGVTEDLLPADVAALDAYWDDRLSGDRLLQGDISREATQAVFRFEFQKYRRLRHPAARIIQAISITALDPRLQAKANLLPNKTDLRLARAVDGVMQHTYANLSDKRRAQAIPLYNAARKKAGVAAGHLSTTRANA